MRCCWGSSARSCRPRERGGPTTTDARRRATEPSSHDIGHAWFWVPDRARYARLSGTTRIVMHSPIPFQTPRTSLRVLAARLRPSCAGILPSENRGRRECRAPGAPAAARGVVVNTRVSHHGRTGITRHSRTRMVLTVSFALSPVTGLVCHCRPRGRLRELDASVGASGPHDFAVRGLHRSSSRCNRVHRIPLPTSVTIAKRPSSGNRTAGIWM